MTSELTFEIGQHVRLKGDDDELLEVVLADAEFVAVVGIPHDPRHAPVVFLASHLVDAGS